MVRCRRTLVALPVLVALVMAVGCTKSHRRVALPAPPTTTAAPAPAPTTTLPPSPPKTLVATAIVAKVKIFPVAGADVPTTTLPNPNEFDVPQVFVVKAQQAEWLNVMLPMRPNGASGWVKAADVTLGEIDWRMEVELGAHRLTVWKGSDVVRQETVAVGTGDAPTPTGDFYVTELLDTGNPRGPYGPWAFGLSAFSDVYTSFAGGPGQIGLHGTNQPGLLGSDVSHGCIRVSNDAINALAAQVPPGTPIKVLA